MSDEQEFYPEGSWEREAAEDLRARFLEFIERHETEEHDGEICDDTRVGLLSFLAHSMGVHSEMALGFFVRFVEAIEGYDQQHAHLHSHNGHHHEE
jgi:hypothetical protein